MNRKYFLFGNLVLLLGFATGYAAAFFTAKKADQLSQLETQQLATELDSPSKGRSSEKDTPPMTLVPAPSRASVDVTSLQAQLQQQAAKILELEQKLADPKQERVTPEEDTPEFREKLAADLMEVTRTKDMIQAAFQASAATMSKELTPEGQEALNQAMLKIYSWEKMEKMFSKVYTDVFSAQELSDMAEYYRSDVGVAMLKKQPEVMQKTMQLVQQINQDMQPQMTAEVKAIIKKHRIKTASGPTENTPVKN